jgi:hypothetical protein
MTSRARTTTRIGCACGTLRLAVDGAPIIRAECHCDSCRTAADRLRALPGVPAFQEPNGGTRYALYRKDRVCFLAGAEHLAVFRLTPASKTRRVVATCCNTPAFVELENGHWLSLHAGLWPPGALPPPQLRTMTSDLPAGTRLSDDVPASTRHTLAFFAKLLAAWISMGFRNPKIAVPREFDA